MDIIVDVPLYKDNFYFQPGLYFTLKGYKEEGVNEKENENVAWNGRNDKYYLEFLFSFPADTGCVNLKKVTIPESVTKINDGAFAYCSKLNIITCLNIEPPKCQRGAFLGLKTKSCVLYVPKGSKEAYSRAKGGKSFKHIEEME